MYSPIKEYEPYGIATDAALGEKCTIEGKVGCLILAAGLGTRLGYEGPKGCFPLSPIKKKSLFQILFERIVAVQKKLGCIIPTTVVVSVYNREETIDFLQRHDFFGLEHVVFVTQNNHPYTDRQGSPLPISAPDGNGGIIDVCNFDLWAKEGIEYMHVIPIDNPLNDPVDPYMTGLAVRASADVVVKGIQRQNLHEKMGWIVEKDRKIQIIDYMEMQKVMEPLSLGHSGHYCIRVSFLCQLQTPLPWHFVEKTISLKGKKTRVLKAEKFLFDILLFSQQTAVICFSRESGFAPLKSLRGADGVAAVQRALLRRDRAIFESISGKKPKRRRFELSAEFLHPTTDLLDEWKGKSLPSTPYIEPQIEQNVYDN